MSTLFDNTAQTVLWRGKCRLGWGNQVPFNSDLRPDTTADRGCVGKSCHSRCEVSGGLASAFGEAFTHVANLLLCDTGLAPDGCVVTIEDVGANGSAGTYVHLERDFGADRPQPALWVHTMSIHECDLVGRLVRVRVLAGVDADDLGELAFDGQLAVPSGIIAVGDARDPGRQLLCGSPSTVDVRVYMSPLETIRFDNPPGEYPASGPSEINVLLRGDPGFSHTPGT